VVGDNQQVEGEGEGEGAELAEGDLGIGLAFECVVSISRICNGTWDVIGFKVLFWTCNDTLTMLDKYLDVWIVNYHLVMIVACCLPNFD
jgi:hypothetical protein